METQALENTQRILSILLYYYNDEEKYEDLVIKYFDIEQDFKMNFIEPFINELNKNLLKKEGKDGLVIVFKHYIRELRLAEEFFEKYQDILIENKYLWPESPDIIIPPLWRETTLSKLDYLLIITYYIYNSHFYEIQDCCIKYNIDFFQLCKELHFEWNLISTGITIRHIETEDLINFKNNNTTSIKVEKPEEEVVEEREQKELLMKQKVEVAFDFLQGNDPRKHIRILKKEDFQNLINYLTYYYLHNFSLPKDIIPILEVNTAKGNIIFAFKNFFKSEHPRKIFPRSLFELYKSCFYEYREDCEKNFLKQRKPQYYDDLIYKSE